MAKRFELILACNYANKEYERKEILTFTEELNEFNLKSFMIQVELEMQLLITEIKMDNVFDNFASIYEYVCNHTHANISAS